MRPQEQAGFEAYPQICGGQYCAKCPYFLHTHPPSLDDDPHLPVVVGN